MESRLDHEPHLLEPSVLTVAIRSIPETHASNYTGTLTSGMIFRLENARTLLYLMEEPVKRRWLQQNHISPSLPLSRSLVTPRILQKKRK
jgi:hypothetical protein